MTKKITIRPATPKDAPAIAEILAIAWIYAYKGIISDDILWERTKPSARASSAKRWEESLRNATSAKIYLVAEDELNEVIGWACGGAIETPELKTDKELGALYVHPALHGSGAGKALMLEFTRLMRAQGAATFGVGCLTANKIGIGFYKHMGGRPVFEIPCERVGSVLETYFKYNISKLLKK